MKTWNRPFLKTAVCCLILFASAPAFGLKEFYSISRSTRALGMGGAFYGLSDDENALFYNPAGLAFNRGGMSIKLALKAEGSFNAPSALGELLRPGSRTVASMVESLEQFQGQPISAGVTPAMIYFTKKQFALGLLIGDTKGGFALLGRDLDSSIDATVISDSGLFVGFGFPVMERLAVGANLKAVFRGGGRKTYTVADIAAGTSLTSDIRQMGGVGGGMDFDLGATYEHPWRGGAFTRVSLTLNNGLASQLNWITIPGFNAPPGLARMVSLGSYTEFPGLWVFDHVGVLVDLAEFSLGGQIDPELGARTGSIWKHLNFGLEVPFARRFTGRLGFRQGNFTAGLGMDLRHFELEVATYAEELAGLPGRLSSRRVALRLAFGWGGGKQAVGSLTETTPPPLKENSTPVPAPAETPLPLEAATPTPTPAPAEPTPSASAQVN